MEFETDRRERLKRLGRTIVLWFVLAAVGIGIVVGITIYYDTRNSGQQDADR
jgi:hypothetical protein